MSVDVLQRPDGSLDAWINCPDYTQTALPPGMHHTHFRTSSPIVAQKKLDRPKSVPVTLLGGRSNRRDSLTSQYNSNSSQVRRPKTSIGTTRTECDRVLQVEQEATRKHNLESHLPIRKPKTPPWQKTLDNPPVPCMVTPGYTLSRSKSKVTMTINTDEFFDPTPPEEEAPKVNPFKNTLIGQLQQQIDDLTLYLEEERLNHRETKQRAAEQLREQLEELNSQHENELRSLHEQFKEQLEAVRTHHENQASSSKEESDGLINKMRGEVEFLQGAFESYKSQLHLETEERWKKRETELRAEQEKMIENKLDELRSKVQSERATETNDLMIQHQKDLHEMKQNHKKEVNQILRRFSNAAKELELFKQTKEELEETKADLATVKEDYDNVCKQVTNLMHELTDTKVELATFQQSFQDRVQSVDDKYRERIHELMTQNTELRRLYVKKCGELFDEKVEGDKVRDNRLFSAKETMKLVIESRNDALVNLAATDPDFERRVRRSKHRPSSAPNTRFETEKAVLSASETDAYVQSREERIRPKTCKPRILEQIQNEHDEELLD